MFEKSVPPTKVGAASDGIVQIGVVWVSCPEGGRCDILVKQARAGTDKDGQVVHELVSDLNTILEKVGAAHDVVDDIASESEIVGGVDVDGTVEGLVNSAFFDIGAAHVAVHVEMNRISSLFKVFYSD